MALPPPPRLPHSSTDAYNNKFQSVTNILERNAQFLPKNNTKLQISKNQQNDKKKKKKKRTLPKSKKMRLCTI